MFISLIHMHLSHYSQSVSGLNTKSGARKGQIMSKPVKPMRETLPGTGGLRGGAQGVNRLPGAPMFKTLSQNALLGAPMVDKT